MGIKKLLSLLTLSMALLFTTTLQAQTINPQMDQNVDVEVSDEELQNFLSASQEIQMLQLEMQQKLIEMVKNSSMSVERFQAISQKQQQGQQPQLSEEEKKAMESLQKQYMEEQQTLKPRMDSILLKYSFDQQRFMAISKAMRTDKELQKRFKELQQKKQ